MEIICDTRQKKGKHDNIERYFKRHGIGMVNRKIDAGDYMLPDGKVSVDTKFGLQEVYGNLVHDHERFKDECVLARDSGVKLVVLVEESGIKCLEDVKEWENPRITQYEWAVRHGYSKAKAPPISSKRLYGIMKTMEENYGIRFMFCHKRSTGKRIVEILTGKDDDA